MTNCADKNEMPRWKSDLIVYALEYAYVIKFLHCKALMNQMYLPDLATKFCIAIYLHRKLGTPPLALGVVVLGPQDERSSFAIDIGVLY